jgi:hypothetical protein
MKRVLLDENLDRRLKNYFSAGIEITTVPDLGWQSKKNGELLSAMREEGIDIPLTSDKNLRFQQNLTSFRIQVVVIIAFDNRLKALVNSITAIEEGLMSLTETDRYVEIDLR